MRTQTGEYGKKNGGKKWLEKNIHAFLPIGGPLLGTPFGSHSYITGDEGQGLAPMVFSYADRHLVVRSWGMFGMIFPTGRHLMLQPTHSVHWVRRQGCLNVHALSVQIVNNDEDAKKLENENLDFYVMVGFKDPVTGKEAKQLKCTPMKMSTSGAIDEHLQFYFDSSPESIDGAVLTITLWRDWVGPIDKEVAKGSFKLSSKEIIVEEGGEKLPGVSKNEYIAFDLPLNEKSEKGKVAVRLKFVPFNDKEMHNDFRRDDPGAFRCGGLKDACSSKEKRNRLLKALGAVDGQEWEPKAKAGKSFTFAPMSVDQMMVLDEMQGE